jgi:lysophospholipase L1-like esterase
MLSGSKKIIIATNHQVTKTLDHEPLSTKYADNAKRYNEAVRNLCSSLNSPRLELIDIEIGMRSRFDNPSEYLLSDGVHLNEFGHSVYFELAVPVVSAALTSIAFNA